jgi:fermentation-respiration switch protein FrsA (DUF1100 family)
MNVFISIIRFIGIFTIVYALILFGIVAFQRRLLFQTIPFRHREPRTTPNLELSHFFLTTADGEILDAVWLSSINAEAGAILYLHGNAANLRSRESRLKALTQLGISILAIDWRGYGLSTGRPSQDGLLLDAEAAYQWLVQRIDPSRLVVLAESIATGIGIKLAAKHKVRALVLEAPYFSAVDLAQKYLPFIPVRALMRDPLRSDLWIRDIDTNLLIQHGKQDRLIPFSQAERLFEIAPEPKRMIGYPLGHHDDLPEKHNSYRDLKDFIAECFSAP